MLFQKIFELAADTAITMTFVANRDAGTLTVTVIPKPLGEKSNPALSQPLSFEATPEELESSFAEALGSYGHMRKSLADTLKDAETVIESAKKDATTKAAKAVKGAEKKAPKAAATAPVVAKADTEAAPPATAETAAPAETPAAAGENLFA